ncbi:MULTISPECIES: hypothetical protein [Niastella]|uniref:Uncharacterized protein n=1 Tax=Niastella soli TaxID=2821487 RepID=A0ABS3Z253_9BACT|nr:hypothetical protein [Niastella soli]MBO9204215.1 hypothetical protein [Niastella soli]
MYRRSLYGMLLVLLAVAGNAQVSISVQEPPAGIVQKRQLWNLALINSANEPFDVIVGLTLIDLSDNQPALSAFTGFITLNKGVKQLKVADIEPIDYEYVSPAFSRLNDALLPVGNYQACYTVYTVFKEERRVLTESCIMLDVQPLSPPQLTMPVDSAIIQNPWPQFSWLPPAPVTLFNDLNYDLLITEVRPDQSAGAAIQENLPIYNARRLTTMVNNYPSSNKTLDTGKVYAWRVIAKNGETFAAQSEVWTFSISQNTTKALTPGNGMYLDLRNSNAYTGIAVIPDNVLGVRYYSYDKSHEAVVKFLNEKREVVKEIEKTIGYGNNYLEFKLGHSFKKDNTYSIELTDLNMIRYRATFRISK